MILRIILLVFGVFCGATAVIMIKASQTHWAELASFRLLVAAAALAPVYFRDRKRHRAEYTRRHLAGSLLPGLLLGLHFLTWVVGARMTLAANASLIVNMVPVVMPLLLIVLVREKLTKGEIVGTALALAGTALLTASDARLSAESMRGDLVCFVSMVLYAAYLALGRKNRHYPTVWLYLVPVYLSAGLVCLAVSLALQSPFHEYPAREVLLILGLGLVPTVMGHSILNHAMRSLRGQAVALANLGQFVFAGAMAWLMLGEALRPAFLAAAPLVVAGVALAVLTPSRQSSTGKDAH